MRLRTFGQTSSAIFDIVDDLNGSISAEHGIGVMKREELKIRSDDAKVELMETIKAAIDPFRIMNPRVMI